MWLASLLENWTLQSPVKSRFTTGMSSTRSSSLTGRPSQVPEAVTTSSKVPSFGASSGTRIVMVRFIVSLTARSPRSKVTLPPSIGAVGLGVDDLEAGGAGDDVGDRDVRTTHGPRFGTAMLYSKVPPGATSSGRGVLVELAQRVVRLATGDATGGSHDRGTDRAEVEGQERARRGRRRGHRGSGSGRPRAARLRRGRSAAAPRPAGGRPATLAWVPSGLTVFCDRDRQPDDRLELARAPSARRPRSARRPGSSASRPRS